MPEARELYTLPAAAQIANLNYWTLHGWVQRGLVVPDAAIDEAREPNLLSRDELKRVQTFADLRQAGLTVEALHEARDQISVTGNGPSYIRLGDGSVSVQHLLLLVTPKVKAPPEADVVVIRAKRERSTSYASV